jgi:3',5'-cyclic AMP phosphodiesterase CpdA
VNTARGAAFKGGRISQSQLARLGETLTRLGNGRLVAVVTHHPLVPGEDASASLAGGADRALALLRDRGTDLLLSGHLHDSHSVAVLGPADRPMLAVHAGTAASRRLRGESNSYNRIVADAERLCVAVRTWDGERFVTSSEVCYPRRSG